MSPTMHRHTGWRTTCVHLLWSNYLLFTLDIVWYLGDGIQVEGNYSLLPLDMPLSIIFLPLTRPILFREQRFSLFSHVSYRSFFVPSFTQNHMQIKKKIQNLICYWQNKCWETWTQIFLNVQCYLLWKTSQTEKAKCSFSGFYSSDQKKQQ